MRINEIGPWLKAQRKIYKRNYNLTNLDILDEIGISQAALGKIESGANYPTLANLENLLDLYGYEIEIVKKGAADDRRRVVG